ncbi:sulfotransferase [Chitinophagaceae bacterium LWZ2-11]
MTDNIIASSLTGWIPYQLEFKESQYVCKWLYTGQLPYIEPFFDETINKCRSHLNSDRRMQCVSSSSVLEEWSKQIDAIQPSAFIFHVSRCGSTLLSQLLGLNEEHIVLSEVPFFDDLLRAKYKPEHNEDADIQAALLPAALQFYGEKRSGIENRLFVKTDSWHLFFYKQIRALYPGIPFILLYRRPDEVIRSQHKKRGMHAIPGIIEKEVFEFDEIPEHNNDFDVYMAAVLEKYFDKILEIELQDPLAYLVNYNEGFASITKKVLELTNTTVTPDYLKQIEERCKYNAKNPHEVFDEEAMKQEGCAPYLKKIFDLYKKAESVKGHRNMVYDEVN